MEEYRKIFRRKPPFDLGDESSKRDCNKFKEQIKNVIKIKQKINFKLIYMIIYKALT